MDHKSPHPFYIGAATAAYQVEGNNRYSDFWVMEHTRHSDFAEPSGDAVDHYHRYAEDMMNGSKRKPKEGDVQVGVTIDMKKVILAMFEQGKAFHGSPFKVNSFLKPRSVEQEKLVMQAHCAAKQAIKEVSPGTKVGLTMSLFDYQTQPGGEAAADKLWQEDFEQYLPYIRDDDFLGVQNYSRKRVSADGAQVTGYLCWSLLDNFEWQAGFSKTFGLIAVDRTTQTRKPKESLYVLGELAKNILSAEAER